MLPDLPRGEAERAVARRTSRHRVITYWLLALEIACFNNCLHQ